MLIAVLTKLFDYPRIGLQFHVGEVVYGMVQGAVATWSASKLYIP
jgi:hypothetical protein